MIYFTIAYVKKTGRLELHVSSEKEEAEQLLAMSKALPVTHDLAGYHVACWMEEMSAHGAQFVHASGHRLGNTLDIEVDS